MANTAVKEPAITGFENEPKNTALVAGENSQALVSTGDVTDFGDYAGAGLENVRMEEQVTPFLRMAQGLSPEVNPNKGEYIPGLALGMMFNTVTREVYSGREGVEFVACWRDYHFGVWVPRDQGGGFRGALPDTHPFVKATIAKAAERYGERGARFRLPRYRDGRWTDAPPVWQETNEEVELVEAGHLYVLYAPAPLTAANARRAIVPFTSTSMPVYTNFVSRNTNQTYPSAAGPRPLPIFAYQWRLTTIQDKNTKGEYANWRIDLAGYDDAGKPIQNPTFLQAIYRKRDPDLLALATAFYDAAKGGNVKVDQSAEAPADDAPPF